MMYHHVAKPLSDNSGHPPRPHTSPVCKILHVFPSRPWTCLGQEDEQEHSTRCQACSQSMLQSRVAVVYFLPSIWLSQDPCDV